jgi:lipopolysaccharide/colanic/teichoic acid biosynthesis glycosyltransferase
MRRLIDSVFAILWLILTAPVLALIALLIKCDSPGPILYIPPMVGHHGKVFSLFRFRTLSADRSELSAEQRLTRVGRFIRHYSLDHLPMVINLLKGDVTLVGPRPMELNGVDLQDPQWQRYFQVKPGLFNYAVLKLGNLWTSRRVSHPTLNQELELEYYQTASTVFDVQLVIRFLKKFIVSGGNVKARGEPDPEVETRLNQR